MSYKVFILGYILFVLFPNFSKMENSSELFKKYFIVTTKIIENPPKDIKTNHLKYLNYKSCKLMQLSIEAKIHKFCLLHDETNKPIKVRVMEDIFSKEYISEYNFDGNKNLISGFDFVYPTTSSVKGFIYNNYFYGQIRIGVELFFIERIAKYSDIMAMHKIKNENLAILYNYQDYVSPLKQQNYTLYPFSKEKIKRTKYDRRARSTTKNQINARLCTVMLIGDNGFLHNVASGNITLATMEMITDLKEAERIFRRTDFDRDGFSDNVGFRIKFIVILNSNRENWTENNFTSGPNQFLMSYTYLKSLKDVCIGIVFTSFSFAKDVIGVSFTSIKKLPNEQIFGGGICELPTVTGEHLNLLAISTLFSSKIKIPKIMVQLSLAHELGHSFGSNHDPNITSYANYLMSPMSSTGKRQTDYKFSDYSRQMINKILKVKSNCFEESNESYCGNELIERGEDCDCGLQVDCIKNDPCCHPHSSGLGQACRINQLKECHPSQGLCCALNCTFRNLRHMGIDCKVKPKQCPCVDRQFCECGYFGECIKEECHNIECTRIGLTECSCTERGDDFCTICCQYISHCLPATRATQLQLKNETLFAILQRNNAIIKSNFVKNTSYCINESCVILQHHYWKHNDYCIFKGKIGTCSGNNKCIVDKVLKQIFPRLAHITANSSYHCKEHFLTILLVIYFLINF